MRLGVVWEAGSNAQYRAFQPMRAMARRAHDILWPPNEQGGADLARLAGCDLVHVYRRKDEYTRRVLTELVRRGTPITYDNDDDYSTHPKDAPNYKEFAGLKTPRQFMSTLKVARMARVFTTPSEVLAEKHRRAGIERVEVIGNYLVPDALRPRRPHEGVVIGWIAGGEHKLDADRLQIADVLRRLVAKHDNVRVECIGVGLSIPERYSRTPYVDFEDLPVRIGGFDIGIAPLADIPWNRARSDIKLKEYAASGVPWLASPVGPYLGLGESQGGRLVPDDGWLEALESLVTSPRERKRLGRKAEAWARGQTIEAVADRWEQVFAAAAGRARTPVTAGRPKVSLRLGSRK